MNVEERIAEFYIMANKLHKKLEKEDESEIVTLYHYRSARVGIDIIKNKKLLFAKDLYLSKNHDAAETKIGVQKLNDCILNHFKERYHLINGYSFWLDNVARPLPIENISTYVLSLCVNGREKEVWNKYGKQHTGVALGFQFQKRDIDFEEQWRNFYSLPATYDMERFGRIINEFLVVCDSFLDKLDPNDYPALKAALFSNLFIYIPGLKNYSFNWEREYRLVMPGVLVDGKRIPNLPKERLKTVGEVPLHPFTCHSWYHTHFAQSFDLTELKEVILGKDINKDEESKMIDLCRQFNVQFIKLEE